ncbi:unnamed protein product [Linum trigynum]|uniref:Uncharacterized protein n=1 Tax=Linum trigynum TaxID=586398 RepID=A0AAV2GH09_9ROSI
MRGLTRAFFAASAANFTSDRKNRVGVDKGITDWRTHLHPEKLRPAPQATTGLGAFGLNLDAFAELTDDEDRCWFLVAGKLTYAGIEYIAGLEALVRLGHTKEAALRRAATVYTRYNYGRWFLCYEINKH